MHDIYIDDMDYSISWFVFNTGSLLSSQKKLLDTSQIVNLDLLKGEFSTALAPKQIEDADSGEDNVFGLVF